MAVIFLIIIAVAILALLIWLFIGWYNTHTITQEFKRCNVIVSGKKGTGKDLIFQLIINKRKEKYKANITYGGSYENVTPSDISVAPNTYQDFINNKITKIHKVGEDGIDVYFSDGGIIFPSQYDAILYKKYPSFPIYYALSRHLYVQNIHVNVQNLNRLWKALREQADYYICCKRVTKLPFFLVVHYITYEKYESAYNNLLPMGNRFFNKFSKAEQDQFKAKYGEIKKRYSIILKKKIKYDTRAFANVLFDNIDPVTHQIIKNEPIIDKKWVIKWLKKKK